MTNPVITAALVEQRRDQYLREAAAERLARESLRARPRHRHRPAISRYFWTLPVAVLGNSSAARKKTTLRGTVKAASRSRQGRSSSASVTELSSARTTPARPTSSSRSSGPPAA